ncbi:MAG: DM13 domain-containing protein [Phormidesmis sp.]
MKALQQSVPQFAPQSTSRRSVLQQLRKLGLAAAIAAFAYQPAMQASSQQIIQPSPTVPMIDTLVAAVPEQSALMAGSKQLAQGASFISADHETSGQAQVVEENGQRYLTLDASFRSDSGPDLFILLHKEANPDSYSPENYVNLGRLQSFEGEQRYAIPADVDLGDFRSAVIWCQDFDVTFGYAVL